MLLRCDMCHKPLKGTRFKITTILGDQSHTLTVGPECFRKEKKARAEIMARYTPDEIEALRAKIAAKRAQAAA